MTPKRRKLPNTASVALPEENGKLHAPSARRNRDAILMAIEAFVPAQGRALEIASGTGEHVVHYAAGFSNVVWQPTDVETARLDSIAAWSAEAGLANILPPKLLDATVAGWAADYAGQDVVILSNLLHLISELEAETLIMQSAQALATGGVLLLYGPFLRGEDFASESDREFHESLRDGDAEIGYKSFQDVQDMQKRAGLLPLDPIDMPSSNLLLAGRKR